MTEDFVDLVFHTVDVLQSRFWDDTGKRREIRLTASLGLVGDVVMSESWLRNHYLRVQPDLSGN